AYLSKLLKAPVKYVENRSENIMSGTHNNERIFHVKLAVRKDGRVTGAYMKAVDNCGAYPRYEPAGAVIWAQVVPGIYDVQNVYVDFSQATTNKGPTGPVRGYSRIQHNFMWERMMNRVAQKLNMDPAEVRRLNLIKAEQMPYEGPSRTIYDGGDYHKAFDTLLDTIEYGKWREKQKEARKQGKLIGIGLSAVIDSGANNFAQVKIINPHFPASGSMEVGLVMIDQFGTLVARTGTTDQGQSHATTFGQIVSEVFNTGPENVVFQQGFDSISNVWAAFSGAYASRSAVMAGTALYYAAIRLKEKVLTIAAHALGELESDLEVKDAAVVSMKTDKKLPLGDIATLAWLDVNKLPEDMEPGLVSYAVYKPDFTYNMPDEKKRVNNTLTYSYAIHGTVVEVDPETYEMKILKHGVVSDPGFMINPLVVEGQEMGATLHGISAALMENLEYDEDGILLTSNFWDYLVAGAKHMPDIDMKTIVTRSTSSVLGVRGVGEGGGGPIGSIVNAVEDALQPLGIKLLSSNLSANELYSKANKK
ncbi:MAG TPA: molybdopterin cofactor-binding domain-containing protein, partial [Thermoplasmataceae archaeon]|nr:molybdopterin cofactor-binding domain-containing protein [Thermoplasmataceae archaeon]